MYTNLRKFSKTMNRIAIITGGDVDLRFVREYINNNEISNFIAVDGGLDATDKLGIIPDYIVGDFDTVDAALLDKYTDNSDINIVRLVPEKDYTDTHTAICRAVEKKPDEIVIFGGVGSRIDHSIANILLLQIPMKQGIPAYIVNKNNKIYAVDSSCTIHKKTLFGPYISILPFGEAATGITLEGFKYPLNDYTMCVDKDISIGISNEIIEDVAKIKIKSGKVLVIEARDK